MLNRKDQIPLVLVQLGPISKQLSLNLKYLASTFPQNAKYLITDNPNMDRRIDQRFIVVDSNKLIASWPDKFKVDDRRKYFRDNFWFSTKARLLLLPKFMETTGISKILHIENDVWLNPAFPFHLFTNITKPLAFPRMDADRGIASVLFVNGNLGIEQLTNACMKWPSLTDMQILGRILENDDLVFKLDSYESDSYESDWIFDGAQLGMYLFGSDPRNHMGIVKKFRKSPTGKLRGTHKFLLKEDKLLLTGPLGERQIANLHIHSKYLHIFSESWKSEILLQLKKERYNWWFGFSINAFKFYLLERCGLAVRKIVRKLTRR